MDKKHGLDKKRGLFGIISLIVGTIVYTVLELIFG